MYDDHGKNLKLCNYYSYDLYSNFEDTRPLIILIYQYRSNFQNAYHHIGPLSIGDLNGPAEKVAQLLVQEGKVTRENIFILEGILFHSIPFDFIVQTYYSKIYQTMIIYLFDDQFISGISSSCISGGFAPFVAIYGFLLSSKTQKIKALDGMLATEVIDR